MKEVCRCPWPPIQEDDPVPTRRWLAAGLVLTLLTPAMAQDAKPVKIEWKFEKDKTFYQTLTTETTLAFAGKPPTHTQKQTYFLAWTPVRQDDKNWALKLKIEGLRLDLSHDGNRTLFDSTQDKNPSGPLSDFFKVLKDVELTITVNPEMQAISVEGRDKFIEALTKPKPQLDSMLNQVLTRDNLKQLAEAAFPPMPNKEVKKGDNWSRTTSITVSPLGTFETRYTCTYDGPDKDANLEKVTVKADMTYRTPTSQPLGFPFKINTADLKTTEGSGSFEFRKDKGRADKSTQKLTLKGKLNVDVGGTGADVEVEQTTTTTVITSDESPVKKK
jgi:hypothetical protein